MTDKIAKKILEMEKDKLLSESESNRDWELVTALDIGIEVLEERITNNAKSTFIASPTEVVKIGEPLSNSDEINKALEKGEIYKRGYKEGYKQAIIDGKTNFSRPQGEWLDNDREDIYRRCSICNELVEKDNYCGNCGADMRKGEKNEQTTN